MNHRNRDRAQASCWAGAILDEPEARGSFSCWPQSPELSSRVCKLVRVKALSLKATFQSDKKTKEVRGMGGTARLVSSSLSYFFRKEWRLDSQSYLAV